MVSEIVYRLIDGEREDFRNGLQRLLNRVPRRGSTTEPEFSTYFFLGSVLTLPYTKLNDEIGIKSSCVKIAKEKTVKTIKLAFRIEKDQKTKLVFKTITTVKKIENKQHLDIGELKEALGSFDLTEDELNNCEVEGEIVHIKDGEVNLKTLEVIGKGELNSEMLKNLGPLPGYNEETTKFKKVKDGIIEKDSLGNALKQFSEESLEVVSGEKLSTSSKGVGALFESLSKVYRSEIVFDRGDKSSSQKLGLSDYEAPIHGFAYGTLAMNFRYEHALRIRPEQAAGKGFVDLVVGSHGREFRVELKGLRNTAQDAKHQSEREGYDKAPIIFSFGEEEKAKSITMIFANLCLDPSSGGLLVSESPVPPEPEGLIELFREHDGESLKEKLKEKLNYLYYSISDSNGGGKNTNYLSRLILGELLADNTLEKRVFIYEGNHIKPGSAEHSTRSKQVPKDVSTEISKMVSTFLFKKQDGKYVILNVIEGENFKINKNIPLDGIELSKCTQVNIKVNPKANGGFEVESDPGKSYYQGIEIGGVTSFGNKYEGKLEKIKHVVLQDITDITQVRGFQEALFPLRKLITLENHFQAILQGLLSAQEGVEVLTEPNYSSRGKPDLLISHRGKDGEIRVAAVELKLASTEEGIEKKRKEGKDQLEARGDGLEVYTNEEKVTATVLVVCPSAEDKDKFITHFGEGDLNVGHSSRGSSDGEPSPKRRRCLSDRRKRNIGMSCIDSRDEEGIEERDRKEKLVSELFDRDKIRKIKENFEFYDQLFEFSKQVLRGEIINPNIERDLIEKFKNIDLDSIDPEIKDIVREIKEKFKNIDLDSIDPEIKDIVREIKEKFKNIDLDSIDPEIKDIVRGIKEKISQEKVNEEIKAILTRSGVAEKIGKIAEGAGHALAIFFVAEHMIKGDIEGLGYDALNLLILPKIGEKVSGKLFELGTKYDSQALRGFAPIAGSVIGNFLAFVGLGESIKALQGATDLVDRKMAELNIATNSLFIAVDIPAVATEIMSSTGVSAGIVGEFVGPVGTIASVTVIIISQLTEAEFKVEKVEESIKLTDEERTQLYWRFFFGIKMPEYIERDMGAKKIYENYISGIIDKFKDDFDTMAISLPKIALEEKKYIDIKDTHIAVIGEGGPRKTCKIQANITKFELDFPSGVVVDLRNISDARNYSRVVPEKIEGYRILCGPTDRDVQVELLSKQEYKDPSFELCSDYFKNSKEGNNGIMIQEQKKWSLDTYSTNCNNAVVYNNKSSNKHRSIYYIKSKEAKIRTYGDSNIAVVFDGNSISVDSTERKGGVSHSTESRQPLKKCEAYIPKNILDAENGCDSSQENIFSKGNHYYFLQPLSSCKIKKPGTNFFYVKGNNFPCILRKNRQTNIVMIQGDFRDSNNKSIQTIIGSNMTDRIEVSHADYVDGKGGNDTITAKNSTTIMGNFGDNIYGKGLVLLPMILGDIEKVILDGDKNTIYGKDGNLTIHGKEMLMRTKDDFFVAPTKTDNRTKMVTHLHVANYNETEVSEVLKARPDGVDCNEWLVVLGIEELYLKKSFEDVGFHFMRKLFSDTHVHKDTSGCFFMESTPVIITLALQGKLMSNSNFNVTKQIFSNELDVVIDNSGHHVFYADRQSHFFYWEGAKNVPNFYLFDDKNVTVIINKGNGLLDFSMVKSEERYKVEVEEDAVFIVKGNVRAVLPLNYKNVTITPDGKKYYKLLQNGTLEREYCSHSLKIDGRFIVNVTDLLNYNCLTFDTDKVFFLRLGHDLQLVSNKEALSILDCYKPDIDVLSTNDLLYAMGMEECADSLDLSIKLSNRIIKPEEFRKRANNPSVLRYYQLGEEGLEIYHNQPTNNHQIGLMDLKDKSILDCSVRITSGNLILSFKNTAIVRVKNWNIYQPAREMMFIFNDTVISNVKCVVSNCNPEDIIKEFEEEKARFYKIIDTPLLSALRKGDLDEFKIHFSESTINDNVDSLGHRLLHYAAYFSKTEIAKFLLENNADINVRDIQGFTPLGVAKKYVRPEMVKILEEEAERRKDVHPIRHRRHKQHHRGHLQERKQGGATSGASKPSSWINVFANTIVGTIKGVSQFISSPFKPAIGMEHSQPSKTVTTQGTDVNGTLFLLDVFIRKITGQKYVSTTDQPTISLPEAVFYASDIINGFEKAVEQAASKSGMSMHQLNINFVGMEKEIAGKIIGGKFGEISRILKSYVEKACPSREAGCPGRLSPKKFDKFMTIFNNRINITLDESILRILHSDHNKSKVKNTEEQQRNLKGKKQPRSYLDDSSVQGLLTQAVVSK